MLSFQTTEAPTAYCIRSYLPQTDSSTGYTVHELLQIKIGMCAGRAGCGSTAHEQAAAVCAVHPAQALLYDQAKACAPVTALECQPACQVKCLTAGQLAIINISRLQSQLHGYSLF